MAELFDLDKSKGNKDIILDNLICGYESFRTSKLNLTIPFGTRLTVSGGNGSGN